MERLTDAQWALVEPHLPKRKPSAKGGRPPADDRACFEGVLWILRTGARWKDLPKEYPSPATCWRRLAQWERALPQLYAAASGIVARLQWNPADPALAQEVSVVTAALARLRLLYGGLPEERMAERFMRIRTQALNVTIVNPAPFAHRGVPCTSSLEANRILLHCELEALFAWLVVETRRDAKTRTAACLAWRAEPDATVIAPAWRIAREEGQRRLYYRPKVASATLARVVRSTGSAMLRPR